MVEIAVDRAIEMSNTIHTAINTWSTDGRTQLYGDAHRWNAFYLLIYLFFFRIVTNFTNNCWKIRRINSKQNWVNQSFERSQSVVILLLALKQLLVSLCKSCLQGSQSVETVIRIFTELQVSSLPIEDSFTYFFLPSRKLSVLHRQSGIFSLISWPL